MKFEHLPASVSDAKPTIDLEKIAEAERSLRQVEKSFCITRHDLRARQIWRWTPERVRAHIAILFRHFCCMRHLACRVALQTPRSRMSSKSIRSALVDQQRSIVRCRQSGHRYAFPSKPSLATERIYAT